MATVVERAREAARRRSWDEALELFAGLDPSSLEPDDLDVMADAAWWSCRIDECLAARQQAYAGYFAAGRIRRAGYAAWLLSLDHGMRGASALEIGWLKRARRHLEGDSESLERGFLAVTEADVALAADDVEAARVSAQVAVSTGERCGSLDLHAMGIQTLGRVLIAAGDVAEGTALLDEAMTLVIGGRLSPMFTGVIYCNVVAACMQRADLGRAGEWNEAAMAWCGSISALTPFHGICRMHYVEITALRGEWDRAESEALRTVDEMRGLEQHVVAEALYSIGEICLRRGDLARAEDSFKRAHELGRDPQPGLAEVRLAQGKVAQASASLRMSLAESGQGSLHRARLLAAQVEVQLAAKDLSGAWGGLRVLEELVEAAPTLLLEAVALSARATVHLAAHEIEQAVDSGRRAWSMWQVLGLPYESARVRMLIGLASDRAGDRDRAQLELEAARAAFERLGAARDERTAAGLLRPAGEVPGGLSARELEVLRLVASGKTNREIAAEMVISDRTVSRHLENIFRKLGVSSRAAATAFAFERGLV